MEIFRPHRELARTQSALQGKFKMATRYLWLDNRRLLDALCKAVNVALSTSPANRPLSHMEMMVSENSTIKHTILNLDMFV
jgi:hypothetical protein